MKHPIEAARLAAAAWLESRGRTSDAAIVRQGGGDDFAEVQAALWALAASAGKLRRLERALQCYADESFWEAPAHSACLAAHDAGEIARAALDGRELFGLHRD